VTGSNQQPIALRAPIATLITSFRSNRKQLVLKKRARYPAASQTSIDSFSLVWNLIPGSPSFCAAA
jgi:hypothetical protein